MDFDETNKAYNRAVNTYTDTQVKYASVKPYVAPELPEVDYAIVKISPDKYIVARSHRLGSLNYDFVCECTSHWEAQKIVEGLNR